MKTTKKTSSARSSSTPSSKETVVTPKNPPQTTPPPPASTPDPNAALEALVQSAISQLDAIEAGLGTDPPLTAAQKRHAVKMRKAAAPVIGQIGSLAQQQGVESSALPVDAMNAQLAKAQALQPLVVRLASFSQQLDDVVFTAQSGAYVTAQQYYAILRRRALTDTQLAAALQPIAEFFARRTAKPKAPGALTKPQERAAKKAVKTLKKTAPQLLQGSEASAPASAPSAAAGATASPPPAPAGGTTSAS